MPEERKIIPTAAVDWSMPLDDIFKVLIGRADNVDPKIVTNEYIRDQYDKGFASGVRNEKGSEYGGYCTVGLTFMSKNEINTLSAKAEKVLAK